jgi:protein involved in polysaccharide export with SLBB domain
MFRFCRWLIVALLTIILLPLCKAQQVPAETRRILAGDEIEIAVSREPELSRTVVVRSDGQVTLALLNDIRVAGSTPTELQERLEEFLKAFVFEPRVTVTLKRIGSPLKDQHWPPGKPQRPSWLLPEVWPNV